MINKLLEIARGELGYKEGTNNNTKYGEAYGLNYNPWCQMFVWWCAQQAGIGEDIIPKTAACPTAYKWHKDRSQVISVYEAKPGDIIFYQWNNSRNADHVGIIEVVNGDMITAIEGNKNDAVERRNINKNNNCIFGICRPAYIVKEDSKESLPEVVTLTKQVTTKVGLNMRSDAGTGYSIITGIPYGKTVVVLQENYAEANGYTWDKIQYNNKVGYVANRYLAPITNPSETKQTYVVQPGDNLSVIAAKFGTTWQVIYNNNREVIGSNPNIIYAGQVLEI